MDVPFWLHSSATRLSTCCRCCMRITVACPPGKGLGGTRVTSPRGLPILRGDFTRGAWQGFFVAALPPTPVRPFPGLSFDPPLGGCMLSAPGSSQSQATPRDGLVGSSPKRSPVRTLAGLLSLTRGEANFLSGTFVRGLSCEEVAPDSRGFFFDPSLSGLYARGCLVSAPD